jgi:DNA repair exonuclease SbcCD ATPase subunit
MTDLREQFTELQKEISALGSVQSGLKEEQAAIWKAYHRLITERQELLELQENEAAKGLDSKIAALRKKVDLLNEKIEGSSSESINAKIARHPESKLHTMAEAIQASGVKKMEELSRELEAHLIKLEKAKKDYLSFVMVADDLYHRLFDGYFLLQRVEQCLPVEKRKVVKPRRAPEWTFFCMEDEIKKAYSRPVMIY